MKVVILHDVVADGASEDELDVLVEAAAVSKALSALGNEPHSVGFSLDLPAVMETIREINPVFIFNLVESVAGQGNLIHLAPALLDYMHWITDIIGAVILFGIILMQLARRKTATAAA